MFFDFCLIIKTAEAAFFASAGAEKSNCRRNFLVEESHCLFSVGEGKAIQAAVKFGKTRFGSGDLTVQTEANEVFGFKFAVHTAEIAHHQRHDAQFAHGGIREGFKKLSCFAEHPNFRFRKFELAQGNIAAETVEQEKSA